MKIQHVSNFNYSNNNTLVSQAVEKVSFKVNPEKYNNEIRELAKKYKSTPNWKEVMQQNKIPVGKYVRNWHNYAECNVATRILLGIFTLGVSEVLYSIAAAINAVVHNTKNASNIKKIEECMHDMNK